jgi:antitoxin VapB
MPLSIKNPRSEELARELAARTGESITEAVTEAVRARLKTLRQPATAARDRQRLERLLRELDALPDLDSRTPDEILSYDEQGLP